MLPGRFPLRINYETVNLADIQKDSLDGGSARRNGATYTGQHKQRKQTSMPRVGFEPTMPVLSWAKTFHALDRAAI
jgi:hypothetical protein